MDNKIYLTQREQDIIVSIAEGLTNQEIGKKLYISVHTVKAHLEKIFEKTKSHNRVQLIVYAFKNNIISWL